MEAGYRPNYPVEHLRCDELIDDHFAASTKCGRPAIIFRVEHCLEVDLFSSGLLVREPLGRNGHRSHMGCALPYPFHSTSHSGLPRNAFVIQTIPE